MSYSNLLKYAQGFRDKVAKINADTLQDLAKYVGSENNPKFFFSMTSVDKIGINPGSTYGTPLGVYCYPLDQEYYTRLLEGTLPFAGDQPHIQLITLSSGTFNINNYSNEDLRRDEAIIKKMYDVSSNFVKKTYLEARQDTPFGKIWNLTRLVSKTALKWNVLLRNLGYDNIYDPGTGTIYSTEPTQIVILDPSVIIHLGSFYNKRPQDTSYNKRNQLINNPKKHKYLNDRDVPALSWDQKANLARNTDNSEIIRKIYETNLDSNDKMVMDRKIVGNPSSPSDILEEIYNKYPDDSDIVYYLSWNINTPENVLRKLYKNNKGFEELARNRNTPVDILIAMSQRKSVLHDYFIISYLRDNPNLPLENKIEMEEAIKAATRLNK